MCVFSTFTGEGPVWNTERLSSFPVGLYVQNSDPHLEKHLLQNICSVLRRRQVMTLDPDVAEPSCVVVFSESGAKILGASAPDVTLMEQIGFLLPTVTPLESDGPGTVCVRDF